MMRGGGGRDKQRRQLRKERLVACFRSDVSEVRLEVTGRAWLGLHSLFQSDARRVAQISGGDNAEEDGA
jgi:hypothetical protein